MAYKAKYLRAKERHQESLMKNEEAKSEVLYMANEIKELKAEIKMMINAIIDQAPYLEPEITSDDLNEMGEFEEENEEEGNISQDPNVLQDRYAHQPHEREVSPLPPRHTSSGRSNKRPWEYPDEPADSHPGTAFSPPQRTPPAYHNPNGSRDMRYGSSYSPPYQPNLSAGSGSISRAPDSHPRGNRYESRDYDRGRRGNQEQISPNSYRRERHYEEPDLNHPIQYSPPGDYSSHYRTSNNGGGYSGHNQPMLSSPETKYQGYRDMP